VRPLTWPQGPDDAQSARLTGPLDHGHICNGLVGLVVGADGDHIGELLGQIPADVALPV
jgi:hypothetical protein